MRCTMTRVLPEPGPASTRVVAVLRHLDQPLLHRVLQIIDDTSEGHVGGGQVQQVSPPLNHYRTKRRRGKVK